MTTKYLTRLYGFSVKVLSQSSNFKHLEVLCTAAWRSLSVGPAAKDFSGFWGRKFMYLLAALDLYCCARTFSSCGEQGPPSSCFSLHRLLCCRAGALGRGGFSSAARVLRRWAHGLQSTGVVVVRWLKPFRWHVGSSPSRDETPASQG